MKLEYNRFPYFTWGEVLTSESLNSAFGYNDEQSRLTRCYTAGHGIIEGLTYTFSNGQLTLHPGVAITPDGHLVKVDAPITYKSVIPGGTKGYDYDLCTAKNKVGSTSFPKNLANYVVVLSAAVRPIPLLTCSEVSCDAKNTMKELAVNVHLREKSHTLTCACQIPTISHVVRLQRMEGCIRNVKLLEKRQKTLFTDNLKRVQEGLEALCRIINPGFKSSNQALMPLKCWKLLFSNATHLAKGLFAFTHSYGNKWHDKMKSHPIYYFQHFETLADAINECIAYYNLLVQNHPLLPTRQTLGDGEVYLGLGNSFNDKMACRYRSVFCHAGTGELTRQARTLERLLRRVVVLCDSFIENNNFESSLNLCWYDPSKPLGERPIPYFYRASTLLYECWPSPTPYGEKPALYWNSSTLREPTNKGCERLFMEGIYRCEASDVVTQLNNYIQAHNLDIVVERVNLVKKSLRSNKGKHPGKDYQKILNATVASENFRKRIAEKDASNPVVQCFNKLPGSWGPYVSAAVNNNELAPSVVQTIVDAFRGVSIENYVDYLNVNPVNRKKTTWIIPHKNNRDANVAAFMALKSYFELSYLLEYNTAEYMQGHPNGSKIVLFCYNDKVFFDANIRK